MKERIALYVPIAVFVALIYFPLDIYAFASESKTSAINQIITVKNWQVRFAKQEEGIDLVSKKTDWEPAEVPGMFSSPFYSKGAFTFMWLKGSFDLQPRLSAGNPIVAGIDLGRIASGYMKVYINNTLIGERRWGSLRDWVRRVYFPIPETVSLKDKNEVYVLTGFMHINLTVPAEVDIYRGDAVERHLFFDRLLYHDMIIWFMLFFLTVGILCLGMFILKKEKCSLYLSLALAVRTIMLCLVFAPGNLYFTQDQSFNVKLYQILSGINIFFMFLFIQSLYGLYLNTLNRIYAAAIVLLFVLLGHSQYGIVYSILVHLNNIAMFLVIAYRLARQRLNRPRLYLVLSVVLCVVLASAYSITATVRNFITSDPLLYVHFICILIFIIYEYKIVKTERLKLYGPLRSGEEARPATITETMEQKLERVIAFLNENYSSDISREGLAAAVSLHPDYMSRSFQKHTGKKINDYINQLRVDDAIRKLESEGDSAKIIDIAFSVGFESLSTFNRAFKKTYGVNPRDFKNRNMQ